MNTSTSQAQLVQTELFGLQRAGAFLSQRQPSRTLHHAHSPPIMIPRAQHRVPGAHCLDDSFDDESFQAHAPTSTQRAALAPQDSNASSSFLAAIRRGLHDNSPSWDNNGWFIGDDSDEEDDDDDFYSSMMDPYSGSALQTAYGGSCAPAGAFARFADAEAPASDFFDIDLAATANGPIEREGSLIFAMEV